MLHLLLDFALKLGEDYHYPTPEINHFLIN